MNVGRHTKIKVKRRKNVILSEKANFLLNKILEQRKDFNLSRYLSEHIIRNFNLEPIKFLKYQIAENNKKIDALSRENQQLSEKIQEIRQETAKIQMSLSQ